MVQKGYTHPNFIAVLFTIAKIRKQPKRTSANEWIKMWDVHTMDYYSAIRNNEIMPFAATWMDPEIITLNKVSKKGKYHMVFLICRIFKKKMIQMNFFTKQR